MKFYNELKFKTEFQLLGEEEQAVYLASLDGTEQILTIKYKVEGDVPGKYECMPV